MAEINTVADLLRKHAEMRGQQIAFSGSGQTVNYAELAARTGRIAVNLQCAGVKRGLRVAIVLGSCIEAVESIFAITRASAVRVSLDPRSSPAEPAKTLERSCVDVIFTDSKRFGRVCAAILSLAGGAETRRTIVVVDRGSNGLKSKTNVIVPDQGFVVRRYEDWAAAVNSEHPVEEPADDLGLDEPAWLHYTTGTTGEPKGVLSSQRAWIWTAIASYIPSLGLTSADNLFWPLPLFHAFGTIPYASSERPLSARLPTLSVMIRSSPVSDNARRLPSSQARQQHFVSSSQHQQPISRREKHCP
ncbi:hypothetical protein BDW66DRAFT_149669 [Aspergillus desertorum]